MKSLSVSGEPAAEQSAASDRSAGLSGRTVVVLGALLVSASAAIGMVTFFNSRTALHRSVARENLTIASTFAGIAVAQGRTTSVDDFLDGIRAIWRDADLEQRGFHLSFVDQDGQLRLHTGHPQLESNTRSTVVIHDESRDGTAVRLPELLSGGRSIAGWQTAPDEHPSLTGLHFEPGIGGLLAISVPTSIINSNFRVANLPWIAAMILVGGVLSPMFLGVLYWHHRTSVTAVADQYAQLRTSEARFRRLYQHSPYCVHELDCDGRIQSMNQAGLKMLGLSSETQVVGQLYLDSVCGSDRARISAYMQEAFQGRSCNFEFVAAVRPKRHFRSCFIPIMDPDTNRTTGLMGLTEDITAQVLSDGVIRSENRMLSFAAMGHAPGFVLEKLVEIIEESDPELLICVYMVDETCGRLKLTSSGRLPAAYHRAVAEIDIRDGAGSCGTAAHRGEAVDVADIATDPLWADDCDFAKQYGLGACTSIPILAGDGEVLGTFACYRRTPGPLAEHHFHLLQSAANLAGLAITRRKAQSRLREQDSIFRAIFDQAAVGVAQIETSSGRLIRVNHRCAQIAGSTVDDLVGRCWMDLTHPEDLSAVRTKMRQLADGDIKEYTLEKRLISLDKQQTVWIKLTASAMWGPADEPATHVGIVEDITQARHAQQALLRSETRYRSLVTSSAAIIWTTDAEGRFAEPQFSWERFTGQSWEDHRDNGAANAIHPEDRDRIVNRWKEAVVSAQTFVAEARVFHAPSGTHRHCEVRATPIPDEHGRVREWVGTTVDVHARKQAEAALKESEQRYRAVVNDQSEFIVRWKPDGVQTFVNDAYCRCFGSTREDMIGTSFFPLIADSDLANVKKRLSALTVAQPCSRATHRVLLPNGKVAWHEWTDRALFDEDGKLLGYQSVGRDITERKLVEKRLRESERQLRTLNASLEQRVHSRTRKLQRANEDLEAYAQSVAHDLRAPLRAITGFALALQEDYADRLDDRGDEYIRFIAGAASQMDDLICDLLTYSRIGQSGMSLDEQDLDEILRVVQSQLTEDINRTQADIHVEDRLGTVIGHRSTLVQLFSNLLSNALKFVTPGTTPYVRIFSHHHEGFLRICVQDNGIGISPESHQMIFRVFERLHGIESYPGTGVGLAIVRRAAESLRGRFGVDSRPGQGSLFWVELPCGELNHV